jgi:hypothetical protein
MANNSMDSLGDVFDPQKILQAEVAGACFLGEDIVVSTSSEPHEPHTHDDLASTVLARWSPTTGTFTWRAQLHQTAGDVIPMADDILALYNHPRLYDGTNGELTTEWPDLATGHADGSIVWDNSFSGPARVAVDQLNRRFAVTDGEQITIVHLG